MEPTGKWTIDQASKNEKNQSTHRNLATLGGGIGGFATGAALSGAALLGGGKLLGKIAPGNLIARSLARSGEASVKSLNPNYTFKKIRGINEAAEITKSKGDLLGSVAPKMKKYDKVTPSLISKRDEIPTDLKSAIKDKKEFKKILKREKRYTKKHGVDPTRGLEDGVGVLSGLLGGATAGGLGAVSARAQYDAGDKMRKEKLKLTGNG